MERCSATSKGTGQQCQHNAIPGGTVCRVHGGASKVITKATMKKIAQLSLQAQQAKYELSRKTDIVEATQDSMDVSAGILDRALMALSVAIANGDVEEMDRCEARVMNAVKLHSAISKAAADIGIEQRKVAVQEGTLITMLRAFQATFDDPALADMPVEYRRVIQATFAGQLRQLQSGSNP